jgi:NodT family efflux transporter outer membrane factor (OMF) lipoprotein
MLKKMTMTGCLLLNACMMVGPDYHNPKTIVEKHWSSHAVKETPAKDASWWDVFHDANLTALINEGYRSNLSVQMAGVRVLQTRAQLAQTVGSLYPQQQALTGSYNYYRMGGSYLQDVLPSHFDAAQLGFVANWEVDFWGKYRRAIASNDAKFLASLAAYDAALVTLTADIATAYISIRTNEALIKITQDNIQLQTMSLKLTQSRYRSGQISLLDVEQAQTELAETQSQLPSLMSDLQHQKDMLAVLLGTVPSKIDTLLEAKRRIPRAPSHVAVGIPKEMLAKRPDVHQARLDAIAQSDAIGAVKANLYPALSLTGSFSFASNTINGSSMSDMFNWSNRSITAGPALSWPLLNYGQITNAVRVQDAVFQQALLNYLNVVLVAQQEAQDSITRYGEAQKTEAFLIKASRSAIRATKLTLIRYKEGESDYTTVLNAEQQQLRVQTSLVNAQGEVPLALVALYRALGGGWPIRNGHDVVPKQIKEDMAARTNWGTLLEQQNHQAPVTSAEKAQQLYLPSW